MCRLVETIRIRDRNLCNMEWHNRRFNRSRRALFGINETEDLRQIITLPDNLEKGTYKCRILYGESIRSIDFSNYTPREIGSLRLVQADNLNYGHKYADRKVLERLLSERKECDDVLIVRNGLVSDTSFSNIIFLTGEGRWITPDRPLLRGTMREYLLDQGRIRMDRIAPADIRKFVKARLINAMISMEDECDVDVGMIL